MNNKYYDPFSVLKKRNEFQSNTVVGRNSKQNNAFNNQTKMYIVKLNNNEKVLINRPVFKIGTKKELCDYIVTDSKYVGRYHARIIIDNGCAFFEDNNSTNKSYINNTQVAPGQRIMLKNGYEIKLADVLFRFIVE